MAISHKKDFEALTSLEQPPLSPVTVPGSDPGADQENAAEIAHSSLPWRLAGIKKLQKVGLGLIQGRLHVAREWAG